MIDTLNIMGIVIFTPFVFIDSLDTLFMIFNGGDWNIVFNTMTRILLVTWGSVLTVFGLMEIHELKVGKAVLIAFLGALLGIFVNVTFIR
jgi:hypothetical protein